MENASKALLIAGAVIISIAVISISVVIYFNVKDAITNINMDETAVATHNSRYSSYLGQVTGSQVKICISGILANNYNETTLPEYKVEVSVIDTKLGIGTNDKIDYVKYDSGDTIKAGNGKKPECDNISNYIKSNYIYNGSVTYNAYGIISKIEFTRQ